MASPSLGDISPLSIENPTRIEIEYQGVAGQNTIGAEVVTEILISGEKHTLRA
jgi:hypothetical protein